ncbi:hypothetical protein ACFU5D_25570 [Streptomyces anthocyanicus]|uniref:Uncharacterized protein n=1 Tax=Streptomyces fuscus TaxID=3048495 RepID=A0ABT7IYI5_9ACTN|nr:hypothetical protein [Streptomyces fuscus]MDL2077656.1 hypothetical protein [Streptomyces fuscus]
MTTAEPLWGPAALQAGLRTAGYTAWQQGDFTVFDYTVETGPRAGQVVRIGLQAAPDFPTTAPGGPHISPRIGHPRGAVHPSGLGTEWEYWSRPVANWAADRSVRGYLRHLRTLFAQLDQGAAA